MASFAIGDVHGNFRALDDVLAQLEPLLTARDTVIFLGDFIDRGPDSAQVIDRILELRRACVADVVTLCGNHEDWLLRTLDDYTSHTWLLASDAFATIESYSAAAAETLRSALGDTPRSSLYGGSAVLPYESFFNEVPPAHLEFLRTLVLYHQTPEATFVHAAVDERVARLEDQSRFTVLMGALGFPDGYRGPGVVVYGHHDNADIRQGWPHPKMSDWAIGIDTISHGVLSAMRMPDRKVFQSLRYA
jgi:serine/threonine protein phosphatase 1